MDPSSLYHDEQSSIKAAGSYATNTPLSTQGGYDSGYSTGKSVEPNTPSIQNQRHRFKIHGSFSPDITPNIRHYEFSNFKEPLPVFSLCSPDIAVVSGDVIELNNNIEDTTFKPDINRFEKCWRSRVRVIPRYGCEIGVEEVDFIKELQCYSPVISKIINYLDEKDIANSQKVSKLWSKVIGDNISLKHVISPFKSPDNRRKRPKSEADDSRNPLENIENKLKNVYISLTDKLSAPQKNQTPNGVNKDNILHEKFKEEAKKLISCEHLWPCPRCNSPARITPIVNRGHCSRVNCQYDFCSNCTTDFHGELPCPVKTIANGKVALKKNNIGSEKSKKNLRRL